MYNKETADKFGILQKATELMPKIIHTWSQPNSERIEAELEVLEKQYKEVLNDMLGFIRRQVNGSVETISELVIAFSDSCHALAGIQMRAENVAGPRMVKTPSPRAKFAQSISEYSIFDEYGKLKSILDGSLDYDNLTDKSANNIAYTAYEYSGEYISADANALAILPMILYLDKNNIDVNKCSYTMPTNSCVGSVIGTAPKWSKRYPIFGYMEPLPWTEEKDGVTQEICDDVFFNFDQQVINDCHPFIKINSDFVEIFTNRLYRFYDENRVDNLDYYLIESLRNTTYREVFKLFTYVDDDNTFGILQSLRWHLDKADKNGVISETDFKSHKCGAFSLDDSIFINNPYVSALCENNIMLNKNCLQLLTDMVESLRLDDIMPGYGIIAKKINALA